MQTSLQFTTNLTCKGCVATVRPLLEAIPGIRHWDVQTDASERPLTVTGENLHPEEILAALAKAGYQGVLRDTTRRQVAHREQDSSGLLAADSSSGITYYPLLLLVMFLIGVVLLVEFRMGAFDQMRAMQNFMGAFFGAFAFFKLLDLRGFADSYRGYDVVAQAIPAYGYVYPFVELGLAVAYITGIAPTAVNLTTLVVMAVSSIGVLRSVLQKRRIRCACLGTVFNLPMSTVTVVEDGLMLAMAAVALL